MLPLSVQDVHDYEISEKYEGCQEVGQPSIILGRLCKAAAWVHSRSWVSGVHTGQCQ
jgi:hypothetical protein